MSRIVDVAAEGIRLPLSRANAAAVVDRVLRAERVANALVSVAFVSDRRIAALNREHLGHGGATDVISFGFVRSSDRDPVVGDIYIAPALARRNAHAAGDSVRGELIRLLVHGTLHVLGYDHPDRHDLRTSSEMWKRQERLVRSAARALGVP